jgi:hypothetical protein
MDTSQEQESRVPKQKYSRSQKLYIFALLVAFPCLLSNLIIFRVIGVVVLFFALIYQMIQTKRLKESLDDKNKKTNLRVVDGIKSLTKIMEVAYDHIKNNTYKLEKIDATIRKHSSELHQLGRTKPRMVNRRIEVEETDEDLAAKARIERQNQSRAARINKTKTVGASIPNDVPNVKHNP